MKKRYAVLFLSLIMAASAEAQTEDKRTFLQFGTAINTNSNMGLIAAHPSLPIGSQVRITNRENGMRTTVVISTRIPDSAGYIIDVSQGAAAALGIPLYGKAEVLVESIALPLGTPELSSLPEWAKGASPQPPVPAAQSPVQPAQSPIPVAQLPVQPAQSPIPAAQSPVQPAQSPAQPAQSPAQAAQLPIQPAQSPVQAAQLPIQVVQLPAQAAAQLPIQVVQLPAQAAQLLVPAAQSPAQAAQLPVQPAQSPAQVAQSPVQPAQSPAQAGQSPVPAGQSTIQPAQSPVQVTYSSPEETADGSQDTQQNPNIYITINPANPSGASGLPPAVQMITINTPPSNQSQAAQSSSPAYPQMEQNFPQAAPEPAPLWQELPAMLPRAPVEITPPADDCITGPFIGPVRSAGAQNGGGRIQEQERPVIIKEENILNTLPAKPVETPLKEAIPVVVNSGSGRYRVQVGAYASPQNSRHALNLLAASGLNPSTEQMNGYNRIVLSGIDAAAIPALRQKLGSLGFSEIWVRRE